MASLLAIQLSAHRPLWFVAGFAFILFLLVSVYAVSVALKKYLRRGSDTARNDLEPSVPRSADDPVTLSASMQSVIQRLKSQEKELERLHREEKQRALQTERLSEAVTRNMPTGLLLVNSNGLITLANPAAQSVLGLATLSYRRYDEALGCDSHLTRLLADCLRDARTFQREEVEHLTPAGDLRQLGVTISPVLAPPPHLRGSSPDAAPGGIAGALCLLSDLTELTALQKQVRLKESLALLGELSAGIAHEFKSALATISGYAQILKSEATPGEQADCAEKIVQETRALTHLVTEFMRFARPLEFSPSDVDLRALVERTATELREEMPRVNFSIEGDFGPVRGDDGLLRQALLNLARNAAQAAADAGAEIRVTLRGAREESAAVSAQRIFVLDNGPGIAAADLPRIFMPFYTTKADGTGLGLAIVQKIAVQHGGTVTARNLPEGGAEFALVLPIRQTAAPQAVDSPGGSI
ncbi:MAG: ATP-binding protein [Acidobacteria bacterium]|nr:ATP-binding protein [Acidobacteriota bacterium]MCL5288265.1 ATP-binding protein [Acidobacteriota bacterium]